MTNLSIIEKICDDLKGQCTKDLREVCEYYGINSDNLTKEDYWYINNEVFECDICGWWCDIADLSSKEHHGMVCSDHDEDD